MYEWRVFWEPSFAYGFEGLCSTKLMNVPRVLVTGGAGFVGSTILQQLIRRHHDWILIVADLNPPPGKFVTENGVEYIPTDVRDEKNCFKTVELSQPTLIIHTAGRVPGGLNRYGKKGREDVLAINFGGTKNMLAAAKAFNVPNFLYTGSCTSITDDLDHEYPNFTEVVPFPKKSLIYGESKVHLCGREYPEAC